MAGATAPAQSAGHVPDHRGVRRSRNAPTPSATSRVPSRWAWAASLRPQACDSSPLTSALTTDRSSECQGIAQGRAGFCETVDEAESFGSDRVDGVAGQEQLAGDVRGKDPADPEGSPEVGDQPSLHFGQPEGRRPGRHHQVAAEQDLESTTQSRTFDRGDQGFGPPPGDDAGDTSALGWLSGSNGEVSPGAEDRPPAREHPAQDVVGPARRRPAARSGRRGSL